MVKRNKTIKVRFTEDEYMELSKLISNTGCSREGYIRNIVKGLQPIELPSLELLETIKLLRNIANNMNQIAIVANSTGNINTDEYKSNYMELRKCINDIMILIRKPLKIGDKYGNN